MWDYAATLHDTVMVDTCHDTPVQTHSMDNIKSEPWCKLGIWGHNVVSTQVDQL